MLFIQEYIRGKGNGDRVGLISCAGVSNSADHVCGRSYLAESASSNLTCSIGGLLVCIYWFKSLDDAIKTMCRRLSLMMVTGSNSASGTLPKRTSRKLNTVGAEAAFLAPYSTSRQVASNYHWQELTYERFCHDGATGALPKHHSMLHHFRQRTSNVQPNRCDKCRRMMSRQQCA